MNCIYLASAREEQLGYDQILHQYLQEQPRYQIFVQSPERFNPLTGDNWYIKIIKACKRAAYKLYILPAKTCRLFNKIVKKEIFKKACDIKPWKQKVPLCRLSYRYYAYELFALYSELAIDLHRELALSCTKIRELDERLFPTIEGSVGKGKDGGVFKDEWVQSIRPNLLTLKKEFKSKQTKFSLQLQQGYNKFKLNFGNKPKSEGLWNLIPSNIAPGITNASQPAGVGSSLDIASSARIRFTPFVTIGSLARKLIICRAMP